MKIAYLVFAYNNPALLKREIEALTSKNCAFFIHIDQKSNLEDFASIEGENVIFSKQRIPVYWAEFSGVEAILLLLRLAMSGTDRYDYFVLLSGSEYPIRSREYIEWFFEQNDGAEFISMVKIPNVEAGKPISTMNTIRIQSSQPFRHFAMRVCAKVGLAQRDCRRYLGNLEPHSGNTWWALSRNACNYILEFVERNEHIVDFFKSVGVPEESFFHTILGNSDFAPRIRRNLVYEDWSTRGAHPCIIETRHVEFFERQDRVSLDDVYGAGELLFARKLLGDNMALVDRIENMIELKECAHSAVSTGLFR